jgi:hypothetical protein
VALRNMNSDRLDLCALPGCLPVGRLGLIMGNMGARDGQAGSSIIYRLLLKPAHFPENPAKFKTFNNTGLLLPDVHLQYTNQAGPHRRHCMVHGLVKISIGKPASSART